MSKSTMVDIVGVAEVVENGKVVFAKSVLEAESEKSSNMAQVTRQSGISKAIQSSINYQVM
jgi:predicted RNA-binding protein with PUA domain